MDIDHQIPEREIREVKSLYADGCLRDVPLYNRFTDWPKTGAEKLMESRVRMDHENGATGSRTFNDRLAVREAEMTLAYATGDHFAAIQALERMAADCFRAIALLKREGHLECMDSVRDCPDGMDSND